ncbi:receptor-type tyrosine-protein phosphatase epsilon-like [Haliotis asinina]|uniref:receptor-type tyrosine-protein phosphatase epsilon-like n=1 Tax=Haliotis asinina TaxID=109174 RepID=UPI003531C6E0
MCSFWMGLLVVCVTATVTDAECHCNTVAACAVFPSTPCSQVDDPDRCQEGWFGSYCQKQNIALRRPCNETSTLWNNVARHGAGVGVDGIVTTDAVNQPCAHTMNESNPTWTVNLNTSVPEKIQHIRLYIRELVQERSNGMEIIVGNQMCYNWSSTEHPPPIANVTCRQPLTGTTVTIRIPGQQKYLTLCEVQIFVCSNGWFSEECDKQCRCLNSTDVCDKITGHCSSGCFPGYNGTDCQTVCPNGTYGNNCSSKCGNCLNGDICDKKNGTCPGGCEAGWLNSTCTQVCPNGTYGNNCSSKCGNCLSEDICDKTNGTCPGGCEAGWLNSTCMQVCPNGTYGNNCSSKCGNCLSEDICDKTNGTCPGGCEAGWMNSTCMQACPDGSYGTNCSLQCGKCLDSVSSCNNGSYGINCSSECGNCMYGVSCDKATGTCPDGCAAGWVNDDKCNQENHRHLSDKPSSSKSAPKPPSALEEDEDAVFSVEAEIDGSNDAAATYYNWVPPHMRLDNLKQCISEKKKKASFESEFQTIPYGARHPHVVAIKPENIPKNRFLALYAYDASRVVLANGEDYINANYIAGYDDDDAQYIATQGPKPGTVLDFWRMVWQEDVTQIVMLTRLMEMNKKKCEQYWPDGGKSETYGSCKVTNKNVSTRADYTVSTFLVENSGVERTVTHYHFTSWPDHGVPSAPALVSFWRLVKQGDKQRGPMMVHCSAGVGRTGAFIALDCLMDEAESKHSINVYMCVGKMRLNRMNMVQTVRQYEFVHDVVMEAFNSRRTLYTSSEFDKTFGDGDTLTTSQENMLKEQFKLLQQQTSRLEEDVTSQALLPENSSKNRNQLILPGNRSRPYLCTPVASRNDYINAVCLPSILRPSTMIVTQTPLPDTVVDFWRLVYDHDCFTIVCLDDSQETEEVYPKDSKTLQIGPFSVIHEETKSNGTCYSERKLRLVYDKEDSELSVTVFHIRSPSLISNTSSLLKLVNEVESIISSGDQQILIHCHDGANVSGVFCSVLNIISRQRLDREVDIFLTIRELQRIRPQFIQSYDQFKLCYKMVKEYNRTSNVYANM